MLRPSSVVTSPSSAELILSPPPPSWPSSVMVVAVLISVGIMLALAEGISAFVSKNPTVKTLALAFLLLIGVMLTAEGVHFHIEKGYIYFAMGFSIFVELINRQVRKRGRRINPWRRPDSPPM